MLNSIAIAVIASVAALEGVRSNHPLRPYYFIFMGKFEKILVKV